jgi:hypothetical protein
MAGNQQNSGRGTTFGRSLMKYIGSKLPYNSVDTITNLAEVNPKYKLFYDTGTRREGILKKHSISQQISDDEPIGTLSIDKNYHNFMYANIDHDKGKRLRDYRVMSMYSEVADALDEICDDFIVSDEDSKVTRVAFRNSEISNIKRTEIEKEFGKFINHFDLENKGWEYIRRLLIDGELFFEHVIHQNHPDKGVLGIVDIPTEVMDPVYDNIQNMMIKGYILRRPVMNTQTGQTEKIEYVPFDKGQVTYIHSGTWNEDRDMRLPFIENCRRSYRQLSLVEDSIVIYRLVRAPERLVFNVDVGNMSPPKAEAYLKKLMHSYWSRKTYDASQGTTINAFDPQSMLDAFWFAKRAGSEGTTVNQLPGGANLGELTDLMYFVKKLYKSLRVPTNRLDVESTFNDDTSVLREELKFAKFIIRLQRQFARGLKDSFVTHLKLRKIWDSYDLKEHDFDIEFNPPSSFHTMREQQIFDIKSNNFNNMSANELISNTFSQKKYLKWDDTEVKQNREWLRKDKELAFELAQIETLGPNWREVVAAQGAGGEPGGDIGGMPGGVGGGSALPGDIPPDFGPGPETTGDAAPPDSISTGDDASALPS